MTPSIPVIIGVADVVNRSTKVEDAREPADLIHQAIIDAINDTGLTSQATTLQSAIDSIDVVKPWTWPYPDLPGLLSQKLGINAKRRHLTPHGGNQPGVAFDEAAKRISLGQTKVAVLTGGEALASLTACAAAKKLPPPGWSQPSEAVESVFSPTRRALQDSMSFTHDIIKGMRSRVTSDVDLGARHDIGAPIHVYPLFENGFRAHRKQSLQDNHRESAKMYANFAKVAEKNPYAWNYGKEVTEEAIATVGKKNRMICFPYPLLMNAFNTVNLAGAVIITSTDFAKELGVPQDRWIYPLAGAGAEDSADFWLRPNFHTSPSISASIDTALHLSGLTKSDLDLYDFYSCFPIVPKLAAHHLGLPVTDPETPLTLLGGLTSFGGAGNNYSMHAITEMTRRLRASNSSSATNGLILANGGVATYQHALVLSRNPRPAHSPYPTQSPHHGTPPPPPVVEVAEGEAVVETYTVEFDRASQPLRGHIVGRLTRTGERFLANHADAATLAALSSMAAEEPVGRRGWVRPMEKGDGVTRNVFAFADRGSRL